MRYPVPQETSRDSTQAWITSDYEPINLAACYDFPIDSPLPSWEDWQAMRSETNPFHGMIERKIGNTRYTILTDCAGGETLIDKVKRLIFSAPYPQKEAFAG